MAESKHTPGPWVWDKPLMHADTNRATQAMIRLFDDNTCGRVLMPSVGVSYLVGDDERTNGVLRAYIEVEPADARLIAAAPDLLEACEEALCCFDSPGPVADELAAAISKAKGETNV